MNALIPSHAPPFRAEAPDPVPKVYNDELVKEVPISLPEPLDTSPEPASPRGSIRAIFSLLLGLFPLIGLLTGTPFPLLAMLGAYLGFSGVRAIAKSHGGLGTMIMARIGLWIAVVHLGVIVGLIVKTGEVAGVFLSFG